MFHDILIIGGGPAGIVAAITCKDMGSDAAIIEGMDRIGKKLLTTGNGRCNLTNISITPLRYHGDNPSFPEPILKFFGYAEAVNFFNSLGLPLTTLEEGKVFPMSLQASSVVDILRFALNERNVPVYLDSKITKIEKNANGFRLLTASGKNFECRRLIICCGGKSAPATGSDGSGFSLAKQLGHTIIEPIPSLVQLVLEFDHLKAISGVKFTGSVKILTDFEKSTPEYGEILFTDYGISGPPVLQLSRIASKAISKNENAYIEVDMMPSIAENDLNEYLRNHFGTFYYRSVFDSLIGIINKRLIPIVLREAGIKDIHRECMSLTGTEINNICSIFKSWRFKVIGTNSFRNAQVTAGGINTKEICPETLESKITPDLYFAGEILDVDGDCGGFNLHWAWASGYVSALNASKE